MIVFYVLFSHHQLMKKCEFYESEFCEIQRQKQDSETQHTSDKADFRRILAKKEEQMASLHSMIDQGQGEIIRLFEGEWNNGVHVLHKEK